MIVLFLVLFTLPLSSQDDRGAIPVTTYPSAGGYRADRDAWQVIRSRSGMVYAANADGLLQFNGVTWTLYPTPNRASVQSLAVDREGRIFAGSDGELGYFVEGRQTVEYHSLKEQIPDSLRNFAQTWCIDTLDGFVYLQTSTAMFIVKGDSVRAWPAPKEFGFMVRMGRRVLVQERQNGLMELTGWQLRPFDPSPLFSTVSVSDLLPASQGRYFLFTKYDGLFLYDGVRTEQVRSPLNDIVRQFRPYRGAVLSTGENAIGVVGYGLIIFDTLGNIRSTLTKETGLQNTTIISVNDDGFGNVWLTGYQGISRFRYPAPVTFFGDKQGLTGVTKMALRYDGRIYAGTVENLFVMEQDASVRSLTTAGTRSVFRRISAVREDCAFILPVDGDLLAATSQGVFVVNGTAGRLAAKGYALPLVRSAADPQRVFFGTYGLSSMVRRNGRWVDEGLYDGITEDVYEVIEERPDVLWLRTFNQGILRVYLEGGSSRRTRVERYGREHGLPSLTFYPPSIVEGRFSVPTENGIYTFSEADKRFVPDTVFTRLFPGAPAGIYAVDRALNGAYWLFIEEPGGYRLMRWEPRPDGTFSPVPLPFAIPPAVRVEWVHEEQNGLCWISTTSGLLRYDPSVSPARAAPFRTSIDRVQLLGSDSLVAGDRSGVVTVTHDQNSFRFTVSANAYGDEERTKYQYWMDGFEHHWSSWTTENRKEYTNLDPGTYRFRVRSQDILGKEGEEALLTITVLPPWYATWWFRLAAVLFFLTVGPVIYYRRVSALKRANAQQEQFSRQLINRQETERKRIAHELHDSISQSLLSIKNRAGMAAERPADQAWMKEQIDVILASSTSAIQEVKQITHNLRPYLLDRIGLTRALQSLLRLHAESSSASVTGAVDEIDGLLPQENEIHLYRIVQEALNNITKHSKASVVQVTVERHDAFLQLEVRDNGTGFDPVQRTVRSAGSGLGLEGIAERARILGGDLRIESAPGAGTRLLITIPAKEQHG
ncbi:MAG: hypothetical protein HUU02_02090 [Bacteroidetes bacterium]|nr:hypothetical protein [Bacteroidota bacterium]